VTKTKIIPEAPITQRTKSLSGRAIKKIPAILAAKTTKPRKLGRGIPDRDFRLFERKLFAEEDLPEFELIDSLLAESGLVFLRLPSWARARAPLPRLSDSIDSEEVSNFS